MTKPVDTSAAVNIDAVAHQEGGFHAKVGRTAPMETHGVTQTRRPSLREGPRPRVPCKNPPPGSAPPENTFRPNPNDEVPRAADYRDDNDPEAEQTSASDTLGGATSADVHTGLGHPGQGQTSTELRHDGSHGRKKQGHGLVGVGASGVGNASKLVDPHLPEHADQRAQDKEEVGVVPNRGNVGGRLRRRGCRRRRRGWLLRCLGVLARYLNGSGMGAVSVVEMWLSICSRCEWGKSGSETYGCAQGG
ncbi:hypothetical protein H2199_006929 [Coniosporium tulheliwenetii]|uniref:Uncharacterized protein n=1 Tax=Coniosporium tulheliwenetii TaxID=3383036 RepID=A0ACC2YT12_9PEZI|nr:hypothetical protein H2199_006929 [Cladosporium sp. JES 115]